MTRVEHRREEDRWDAQHQGPLPKATGTTPVIQTVTVQEKVYSGRFQERSGFSDYSLIGTPLMTWSTIRSLDLGSLKNIESIAGDIAFERQADIRIVKGKIQARENDNEVIAYGYFTRENNRRRKP